MIRRTLLAAVALTVLGGVATPAFADLVSADDDTHGVCLLGTNRQTGARDGICIWMPGATGK
jgi:hypothetical protein